MILGKGLFTDSKIEAGEYVAEYKGNLLLYEDASREQDSTFVFAFHHNQKFYW